MPRSGLWPEAGFSADNPAKGMLSGSGSHGCVSTGSLEQDMFGDGLGNGGVVQPGVDVGSVKAMSGGVA